MELETTPETLILGGTIHPLGGHRPVEALLVRGGRVAALGDEAELRALAAPGASVLRLEGATVTPGLTDAHAHPTAWALSRGRVELRGCATLDEALERVRDAAGGEGWILGQGWSRHAWGGLPDHRSLDRVAPARPVYLESRDVHAAWLNGAALRLCGIGRDTPDPPGGSIVRDPETGEPTGVLLEEAKKLATARLPEPALPQILTALADAQREAHRLGLTGLHSVEPTGLRDFEALRARGALRLRVLQHVPLAHLDAAIDVGLRSGFGGPWLRVGGVKMFLDGSLGSRTAWMREPYEGGSDERGMRTLEPDAFRDAVRRAADAGLASTVHAIGDAAVALAVEVLGATPAPDAIPHRIEHVQLCPPELHEALGRGGVVASMQPVHLLTDIPAAEASWGHERSRGAYAFAALRRAGVPLAFGSDAPVETIDPRPGLFAAMRRETWTGPWAGGEWYPEHRLTAAQALAAYTEGPAFAAGELHRRGRLLPGYDADLVAWELDPLLAPPDEVREMRCVLTMVGGEVVFRAHP